MESAATPGTARLAGLDTLRALAILLVIPRHGWELMGWGSAVPGAMHGWVGVDLFFVLSGFLIGSQLLQEASRDGQVRFGRFYAKRAFRILPCYFIVLLLYALWPAFNEAKDLDPLWRYGLFVMNIGPKAHGFSHAWSLCVEEHFYWIVPLLVAWRWGQAPRRCLTPPVVIIATVVFGGMALRYAIWASGAEFYAAINRPTYCRLDGLTMGVVLALLREHRPQVLSRITRHPWALACVGILLVVAGVWTFDDKSVAAAAVLSYPLVALGCGGLVAAALAPGFWLATRRIPGAGTVATASYALYLTHKQMMHFAMLLVDEPKTHRLAAGSVAVVLIAGAGAALHWLVERPFLRLRHRLL